MCLKKVSNWVCLDTLMLKIPSALLVAIAIGILCCNDLKYLYFFSIELFSTRASRSMSVKVVVVTSCCCDVFQMQQILYV